MQSSNNLPASSPPHDGAPQPATDLTRPLAEPMISTCATYERIDGVLTERDLRAVVDSAEGSASGQGVAEATLHPSREGVQQREKLGRVLVSQLQKQLRLASGDVFTGWYG